MTTLRGSPEAMLTSLADNSATRVLIRGLHTSEQDLQILVVTRSFILIELDNVNARHVAPKVLSGAVRHQWWPGVADESRLATFLHPLWCPMRLFERRVAVLLVGVPVFCLTGFAAVLLICQ